MNKDEQWSFIVIVNYIGLVMLSWKELCITYLGSHNLTRLYVYADGGYGDGLVCWKSQLANGYHAH